MAFVRNNNNNRRHNNNYSNNRHRHNNQGQGQSGQNGQRRHVNRINQVFESNGPEGRVRGTAQQIVEKYLTMSRDIGMSGDRVLSQNYLQHAEHYQRLLNEITEENAIFEKEREATRQSQQSQPDISPDMASEGFAASEAEAPAERGNRPQRQPRQENDEAGDNELPSFLHVPIKEGKPEENASESRRPMRPRRTAAVQSDEATANSIADGPSDE